MTIYIWAGGQGDAGSTLVLKQEWRPFEGGLCTQSVPHADTCATL
jgi:hypothetical protein